MACGLVGDVRAATVYFILLSLEIPFEILPPAFQTSPPEALAHGHPCGFRLSDPERHVQAAPVRATPCCEPQRGLPQTAGTAAIAGGEG